MMVAFVAQAQRDTLPPSVRPLRPVEDYGRLLDTVEPLQFHIAFGTGINASSYASASYFSVTPSLTYRPNDRLSVTGSVTLLRSVTLAPDGYRVRGYEPHSMAPYRNPAAVAYQATVSASYKVNERLWLAASLQHINGPLAAGMPLNFWMVNDRPLYLDATSFSAAMRYRFNNDSFIDIYLNVINDRAGTLMPSLYDPYCSSIHTPYCSPFYTPLF